MSMPSSHSSSAPNSKSPNVNFSLGDNDAHNPKSAAISDSESSSSGKTPSLSTQTPLLRVVSGDLNDSGTTASSNHFEDMFSFGTLIPELITKPFNESETTCHHRDPEFGIDWPENLESAAIREDSQTNGGSDPTMTLPTCPPEGRRDSIQSTSDASSSHQDPNWITSKLSAGHRWQPDSSWSISRSTGDRANASGEKSGGSKRQSLFDPLMDQTDWSPISSTSVSPTSHRFSQDYSDPANFGVGGKGNAFPSQLLWPLSIPSPTDKMEDWTSSGAHGKECGQEDEISASDRHNPLSFDSSNDFSPVVGSPSRRSTLPTLEACSFTATFPSTSASSTSVSPNFSIKQTFKYSQPPSSNPNLTSRAFSNTFVVPPLSTGDPTQTSHVDGNTRVDHNGSNGSVTPMASLNPLSDKVQDDLIHWTWPVASSSHFADQATRDRVAPESPTFTLDLEAVKASLPAVQLPSTGSSSHAVDSYYSSTNQSPSFAACSMPRSRYVQVDAFVSGEARAARLFELIHKAEQIKTYSGWCGVSTTSVVIAYHDVRGASSFVNVVDNLLKSSQVQARTITRKTFEEFLDAAPMLERDLLSTSEGVLVVAGVEESATLNESHLLPLFSTFGSIRWYEFVASSIFVCEYNDDRAAEAASSQLDGHQLGSTTVHCSYEPSMTKSSSLTKAASISPLAPSFVPDGPAGSPLIQPRAQLRTQEMTVPQSAPVRKLPFVEDNVGASWHRRHLSHPEVYHMQQPHQRQDYHDNESTRRFSLPATLSIPPATIHSLATGAPASLPPTHGICRDERIPRNNMIDIQRIEQGLDLRTTLMLKNIPNKLKDNDVMKFVDEAVGRCYQFLYIRLDWSSGCNVGYGFIDFNTVDDLLRFVKARVGTKWNLANSDKICVASYANIQGKAGLITHFKNSSVLDQNEERRPKLFYPPGHPLAGQAEPFPACDDPVRRARSAANAASIGLYPAVRPKFKVAEARSTQT